MPSTLEAIKPQTFGNSLPKNYLQPVRQRVATQAGKEEKKRKEKKKKPGETSSSGARRKEKNSLSCNY